MTGILKRYNERMDIITVGRRTLRITTESRRCLANTQSSKANVDLLDTADARVDASMRS